MFYSCLRLNESALLNVCVFQMHGTDMLVIENYLKHIMALIQ